MKKYTCSRKRDKIKKRYRGIIALTIIISTLILSTTGILWQLSNVLQRDSIDIKYSDLGTQDYSGLYDGGIRTMGMKIEENTTNWTDLNQTSILNTHNMSNSGFEYSLNRLDIRAYNIYNGSGSFSIAEDTTRKSDIVDGHVIAQAFTTPQTSDLLAIERLNLYLEYSLPGIGLFSYIYFVGIYDEYFQDTLGSTYQRVDQTSVNDWVSFNISSNILDANTNYFIVYYMLKLSKLTLISKIVELNTWKAENRSMPYNNLTGKISGDDFIPIQNDTYRDMLCNFTFQQILNPEKINLKFIIEDKEFTPSYQKSLWTGALGYEGYLIHNLGNQSIQDVNVTITTNQTIPNLDIHIRRYYTYTIDSSGYYNVSGNTIDWTINYEYYDIGALGIELWFLYETDWELQHFYNTLGSEVFEVYFGPMKLFNISYYGLFDLWGTPLEPGTCVGMYQSPNYCNDINTKVKIGNNFQEKGIFQLGQTIKLEAEIRNSLDEPISGGSGKITFKNPSGAIIYEQENITSINGIMNSSEILIEGDFTQGNYDVDIFWTDGKEVAFYSIQIEVKSFETAFPIEILILIGVIAGLTMIVVPTARKYIKQRNWEKSLRNLFVLSKDGVNMYNYAFGVEIQNPELISGMISALMTFMKEATGSKQDLRIIDQEDKKVILGHGDHIKIALVCDKDLPIIHKRVIKFTEEFESHYGKRLLNWTGELTMFKDAEPIVMKYFPVSMEEKIIYGVRQKLMQFREVLQTTSDPKEIVTMMHEITEFSSRYQEIITRHYMKYLGELIKIAEEKIRLQ